MNDTVTDRFDAVLNRFDVRHRNGTTAQALCPAHPDRNPSLSITQGDKAVMVLCRAGCATKDVLAAAGLTMADLFPDSNGDRSERRIVATYPYTDEHGELLYEVVRFAPKDFRQRRPDGPGRWAWNLRGVDRVLYRLPEVIAAVAAAGQTIYICEGEKDADAIAATGCVATCNPAGAGKWHTVTDAAERLRGADVIIVADRDEPGRRHAADVARSLQDVAQFVTIAEAAHGKDAADHLAAGHSLDELEAFASNDPTLIAEGVSELAAWLAQKQPAPSAASRNGREPCHPSDVDPEQVDSLTEHDPGDSEAGPNLPDEFWTARPALNHIRQAAHCRSGSADALLGAVLARIAASVPHDIRIPAIVGTDAPISLLVAIVGRSGAGKSSGKAVASELVPITNKTVLDDIPIGSGEGLIEAFYEWITETVANDDPPPATTKGRKAPATRNIKKKVQTKHGMFAYLDEGQALASMSSRQGSTLLPTLRTAWSGGTLGQANASIETKRMLRERTYSVSAVIGFQLEHATSLLDDDAGGTPQRFTWHSANDPTIPDDTPPWPGPLDWELPFTLDTGIRYVDVCDAVQREIKAQKLAVTRGTLAIAPLDAHANLVKLRTATVLAVLDGRLEVTEPDWHLAGMVWATSCTVRSHVATTAARAARRAIDQRIAIESRVQSSVTESVDQSTHQRALRSSARSVALKIHRSSDPLTKSEAKNAIAGKYRRHLASDLCDVFDECIVQGWIERVEVDGTERFRPGRSMPT